MSEQQKPVHGTYLAFDYGSLRIGSAVGESMLGTAQPLIVVPNQSGTPVWSLLDKLINEWNPKGLVVGIPLTLDGSEQDITPHAKGFLKALKRRFELATFAADERFSSMQAQQALQKMRARGQRGKTDKADIDKLAAAFILERWFDENQFDEP